MAARLNRARAEGLDSPKYATLRRLTASVEADGTPWSDERVATALVLFVWGAYVEVAALSANAVVALGRRPDLIEDVRLEVARAAQATADSAGAAVPAEGETAAGAEWEQWNLPLTNGVLRESLRLRPPAGGGFRVASEQISIAGYDVEAGTVVTADARIANLMASLHPDPERFEPRRWVAPPVGDGPSAAAVDDASSCPMAGLASRLKVNAWHPGGIGLHSCPGVPLAELCSRIFVARWVEAFDGWAAADGVTEPMYELVPICIPVDSYKVEMAART
jgi:cytochrome P450